MASALPILMSEDDTNRFKNKAAIDGPVPKAFDTLLSWCCKKMPGETFLQYLKRIKPQKYIRDRWGSVRDQSLIDHVEISSTNCDVTLLNKLIRSICVEIDSEDKVTRQRAQIMIGHLSELTQIRNVVVHNHKTDAIDPDILQNIETKTEKLFTAAKVLYSLENEDVQRELDNIKTMLQDIQKKGMTEKEAELNQISNTLCIQGKKETNVTASRQATDVLPFSTVKVPRTNIYHRCKLKIVKNKTEHLEIGSFSTTNLEGKRPISSEELFTNLESDNLIIIGEPGSGKSTLLKTMREDFGRENENEIFSGINNFDMLLYMDCKKELGTLSELIKHNFPKTLKRIKADDAIEAMLLRKLLICVDGIDELNTSSRKLLRRLIDKFSCHAGVKFIFTSRPGATRWLEEILSEEGIHNTVLSLLPLNEEHEQIDFLNRYRETIPGLQASDLIVAFQSLDESCKIHLTRPIHLALFCHLYHKAPSNIGKWKTELKIMNQTLSLSEDLIRKRLEQEGLNNCEHLANQLIDKMKIVSLRQIKANRLTLQQHDYTNLCKDLFGKSNFSYYSVLSCLLVGQSDQKSFEYLHKSQAEFLAANALLTQLIQTEGSILSIINQVQSHRCDVSSPRTDVIEQGNVYRFSNVFRFVMMDLLDQGHNEVAKRCLEEFCPALVAEKIPVEYWLELTASCLSSEDVARTAAKAAKSTSWGTWPLSSPRHMAAATLLLPHHQPRRLTIFASPSGDPPPALGPLLREVSRSFTGRLWLLMSSSYSEGSLHDHLLESLTSSKCRLQQFRGYLSPNGQQTLASLVQRAGDGVLLYVCLQHPRRHQLADLGTVKGFLAVRAHVPEGGPRRRRPLPPSASFPPALTVVCSATADMGDVVGLIGDLAPLQDIRHVINKASKMTLEDDIRYPMSVTNEEYIFEEDETIAKDNAFEPGSGGKWLLFVPLDKMDSTWEKSCRLYRQRQFDGITSIKSSTAMHNPNHSSIKQGVIGFHCGPSDDEELMKTYVKNIIEKLDFANETGFIPYKSEQQTKLGTRASGRTQNSLYKVKVPKLSGPPVQATPELSRPSNRPSQKKEKTSNGGQYRSLGLQHWHGTDDELDELVCALNDARVRTLDSGSPRWSLAAVDSRGLCEVCEERSDQPEHGRCVRLLLP